MKIIDLLNKIANGEEVPRKIQFCLRNFEYNDLNDYICVDENDYKKDDYCNGYSIHKWIFGSNLNDEIEVLDEIIEEPKKIEKLNYQDEAYVDSAIEGIFFRKINEIIDYINNEDK